MSRHQSAFSLIEATRTLPNELGPVTASERRKRARVTALLGIGTFLEAAMSVQDIAPQQESTLGVFAIDLQRLCCHSQQDYQWLREGQIFHEA